MDRYICKLDLPPLPEHIEHKMRDLCLRAQIGEARFEKWKKFYPNYALAAHEYPSDTVPPIPIELLQEMNSIYAKFFDGGVGIVIGAVISPDGTEVVVPPHCDRLRRTGINYLLDLGGENVETTFYHEKRRVNDLSTSQNAFYEELNAAAKYRLAEKTWHAFDPQRFHSVEKIVSRRHYLSIYPIYNLGYEDFLEQYDDLVIEPYEQITF